MGKDNDWLGGLDLVVLGDACVVGVEEGRDPFWWCSYGKGVRWVDSMDVVADLVQKDLIIATVTRSVDFSVSRGSELKVLRRRFALEPQAEIVLRLCQW
jgi:hypothetical protein